MSINESLAYFLDAYKNNKISQGEAVVRILHLVSSSAALKIEELEQSDAYNHGGISISDLFSCDVVGPLAFMINEAP
jgi:NADPH-dependent 7-cyano-7-deazaguanine reductase QueF